MLLKRKHTKVCLTHTDISRNNINANLSDTLNFLPSCPVQPSVQGFVYQHCCDLSICESTNLSRKLVLHSRGLPRLHTHSLPLFLSTASGAFCAWTHAQTRVHSCDGARPLPLQLTYYADVNRRTRR